MKLTTPSGQAIRTAEAASAARIIERREGLRQGSDGGARARRHLGGVRRRAQFTAIMGPSGSGKSTLLHCLAGLDRLTSGQVLIGERRARQARRQGHDAAAPRAHRLRVPGVQPGPDADRAGERRPPAHPGRQEARAGRGWRSWPAHSGSPTGSRTVRLELSGGQQQRVATARALVTRPDLIFADEPTGNLDSKSAAELLAQIRRAVDEYRQTVVMVTHDPARRRVRGPGAVPGRRPRGRASCSAPTADQVLDAIRELGKKARLSRPCGASR